ncbi:hypothetical protein JHW43_006017 [Diplocarpon mali]|nr:hypothetical protein JHW43_006017 [Diplocarpon mali]
MRVRVRSWRGYAAGYFLHPATECEAGLVKQSRQLIKPVNASTGAEPGRTFRHLAMRKRSGQVTGSETERELKLNIGTHLDLLLLFATPEAVPRVGVVRAIQPLGDAPLALRGPLPWRPEGSLWRVLRGAESVFEAGAGEGSTTCTRGDMPAVWVARFHRRDSEMERSTAGGEKDALAREPTRSPAAYLCGLDTAQSSHSDVREERTADHPLGQIRSVPNHATSGRGSARCITRHERVSKALGPKRPWPAFVGFEVQDSMQRRLSTVDKISGSNKVVLKLDPASHPAGRSMELADADVRLMLAVDGIDKWISRGAFVIAVTVAVAIAIAIDVGLTTTITVPIAIAAASTSQLPSLLHRRHPPDVSFDQQADPQSSLCSRETAFPARRLDLAMPRTPYGGAVQIRTWAAYVSPSQLISQAVRVALRGATKITKVFIVTRVFVKRE